MQYYINEIKGLLKNYHFYKGQIENGIGSTILSQKMDFIDRSINSLDKNNNDLITMVYINKIKIKDIAKKLSYTRFGVYKKIDRILLSIAKLYKLRFESVQNS